MISLLLPTRNRPTEVQRFIASVFSTADHMGNVEIVLRIDDDDTSYPPFTSPHITVVKGPRQNLSLCYPWQQAKGNIYGMMGDDVVFRTEGWDTRVEEAFYNVPDKIALVYGDDGNPYRSDHASHPFLHYNWIEATGRFLPPYFSGDFCDTWFNDLADGVGRKKKVDIVTEHLHPAFGKRPQDTTDKDKWDKHFKDDMPKKYKDTLPERKEDIEKLKAYIESFT